jgi:hypothetical protein
MKLCIYTVKLEIVGMTDPVMGCKQSGIFQGCQTPELLSERDVDRRAHGRDSPSVRRPDLLFVLLCGHNILYGITSPHVRVGRLSRDTPMRRHARGTETFKVLD